jgi:hypothetical protein
MPNNVNNAALRVDDASVAECITCQWRYVYKGKQAHHGARTLAHARSHALARGHETIVHRSTSYDGRRQRRERP